MNIDLNWLRICEDMVVFRFSAKWCARKCMQPFLHVFASPGETKLSKFKKFSVSIRACNAGNSSERYINMPCNRRISNLYAVCLFMGGA